MLKMGHFDKACPGVETVPPPSGQMIGYSQEEAYSSDKPWALALCHADSKAETDVKDPIYIAVVL